MRTTSYFFLSLLVIWIIVVVSPIEFTHQITAYTIFIVPVFALLFQFHRSGKLKKKGFYMGAIAVIVFIAGYAIFPRWGSGWKTQTITHRKINNSDIRIEFQMEDIGAFGYNRRTVEVRSLTPFFQLVKEAPQNLSETEWKEVNEDVNELGLKGG